MIRLKTARWKVSVHEVRADWKHGELARMSEYGQVDAKDCTKRGERVFARLFEKEMHGRGGVQRVEREDGETPSVIVVVNAMVMHQ